MRGIETYKTKSGFTVARVHYSADPSKDTETEEGKEWLKGALKGVMGGISSSAWRKEMEIDFRARSGQKVLEGLELMKDKVFIKPFEIEDWWKIEGGYDFGTRNPFSYHDYSIDGDQNIYAAYEAYGSGYEIPLQASMINQSPYASRNRVRWADPSIWAENEHTPLRDGFTSKQQIFSEYGVIFQKGRQDDIAAVERLELMLFDLSVKDGVITRQPKENPRFKIFMTCPKLWEELINLRWDDFSSKIEENRGKKEQIKQVDNHAWDDLKYFILSLPDEAIEPKPRSKDPAFPLAGELIEEKAGMSEFRKLMRA